MWETRETHRVYKWENLREGDNSEDISADRRMILKRSYMKHGQIMCTGLASLKRGASQTVVNTVMNNRIP